MTTHQTRHEECEAEKWDEPLAERATEIVDWVRANGGEAFTSGSAERPRIRLRERHGGWQLAYPNDYVLMTGETFTRRTAWPEVRLHEFVARHPAGFEETWEKKPEASPEPPHAEFTGYVGIPAPALRENLRKAQHDLAEAVQELEAAWGDARQTFAAGGYVPATTSERAGKRAEPRRGDCPS